MKKKSLLASTIILIFILILGGFLAYGYYQKATFKIVRPLVTMDIKDYGTVKIELYPDMAPNTVKNFIKLINEGYYNGLTFHRVEESLIQGGDKAGDGTGETEFTIKGEFAENDYKDNTMKFKRGTIGLARQDYTYYSSIDPSLVKKGYDSGYSQFFIITKDISTFDGYYAPFGTVIEGMDIIDKITKLETKVETDEKTGQETPTNQPVNPPIISNIKVDTFGTDFGNPVVEKKFDINNFLMQKLNIKAN